MSIGAISLLTGSAVAHASLQRRTAVPAMDSAEKLRAKTLQGVNPQVAQQIQQGMQGLQQGNTQGAEKPQTATPQNRTYSAGVESATVSISRDARMMQQDMQRGVVQQPAQPLTYGKPMMRR